MISAFLGLGSNLQSPRAQLQRCIDALAQLPGTQLMAVSPFYGSAAVGPGTQPDYVNAVAQIETALAPQDLLTALQHIEQEQGRERGPERWLPRTLDLDILLYGDQVVNLPHLHIPHPRMHERNFVLLPLFDLAPDLALPDGQRVRELLQQCSRDGIWLLEDTHTSER